ncbi:MAG: hypothetical protein ACRDVO_17210 [Jiangellaceae bacterium]|nr:hypothetical protein [Jiangellaceae bacterium]
MARRRRRRGHLIPWGPRRRGGGSVDPGWPSDPSDGPFDRPGGHPPDSGGAGVREPRRPKPTLPGLSAEAEPAIDLFIDVSGPR